MMDSLDIKNFKCFKDLKINSLSQVNLIVGMNNVGKSALLEAISVFASKGDIQWFENILISRGEHSITHRDKDSNFILTDFVERYLSLFYNFNDELSEENKIFISDSKNTMTIQILPFIYIESDDGIIKKFIRNNEYDGQLDGIGIEVTYNDKKDFFDYKRVINRFYQTKLATESLKFIRTTDIRNNENASLFDGIALTDNEHYIIEALNIINDKISKINFINESSINSVRSPFVVLKDDSKRYRLSSMGDGMNRILNIILSMLNSKNGILLVDEFENGLHHSVQQKLWEMIFYLSKELNIQVFATTHSNDCIKSFVKADKEQQGKLIRLERSGENITSIPFNNRERLKFAINNDIEMR